MRQSLMYFSRFPQLMGIKMEVRERVYGVDGEKIALIKFWFAYNVILPTGCYSFDHNPQLVITNFDRAFDDIFCVPKNGDIMLSLT